MDHFLMHLGNKILAKKYIKYLLAQKSLFPPYLEQKQETVM